MRAALKMETADCWALLARASAVHLAIDGDGRGPTVRPVNGVVHDGALWFHGSPRGEKIAGLGRPALVCAHENVAEIPSHFRDPERACPATTLYESVELRGVLEEVTDLHAKAAGLQALMRRFQPEGGHAPVDADDPRYRSAVRGLLVARVRPESLVGKRKLMQDRPLDHVLPVLAGLWRRGRAGDLEALERIRAAHPARPVPEFLRGPDGATLCCAPGPRDAAPAVALVRDQYWIRGSSDETLAAALAGSAAWVCARPPGGGPGDVIATARAISDGRRSAWIYDVAVAEGQRARGLGTALLRLLLDHPRLRSVERVNLQTRDAQRFYARMGFQVIQLQHDAMRREAARR